MTSSLLGGALSISSAVPRTRDREARRGRPAALTGPLPAPALRGPAVKRRKPSRRSDEAHGTGAAVRRSALPPATGARIGRAAQLASPGLKWPIGVSGGVSSRGSVLGYAESASPVRAAGTRARAGEGRFSVEEVVVMADSPPVVRCNWRVCLREVAAAAVSPGLCPRSAAPSVADHSEEGATRRARGPRRLATFREGTPTVCRSQSRSDPKAKWNCAAWAVAAGPANREARGATVGAAAARDLKLERPRSSSCASGRSGELYWLPG
jgi:hypothetical protein